MTTPTPRTLLLSTSLGLLSNAIFASGSITLSQFPIQTTILPPRSSHIPSQHPLLSAQNSNFLTPLPEPNLSNKAPLLLENDVGGLLRGWVYVFLKGARSFPPFAVTAAVSYILAARSLSGGYIPSFSAQAGQGQGQDADEWSRKLLYILAALLSIAIFPFTQTVLRPTNSKLYARVEKRIVKEEQQQQQQQQQRNGMGKLMAEKDEYVDEDEDEEEKREIAKLIAEWGRMNVRRSLWPCGAAACAVLALCW